MADETAIQTAQDAPGEEIVYRGYLSALQTLPDAPVRPEGVTVGRPHGLTKKRAQTIVQAIRDGNYPTTAAKLAGIDDNTLDSWMAIADQPEHHRHGDCVLLRHAMAAAEAACEAESVRGIRRAGEKDWKAHASFLGRRHRDRWSEQPRQGESGPAHVTINVGIVQSAPATSPQVIETTWDSVPLLPKP